MDYDIKQAWYLLDEYIMYSVNNKSVLYFTKKDNRVLITNDFLTTTLSYNDFTIQFQDSKFSIYKKISEITDDEPLNDYRPKRQ